MRLGRLAHEREAEAGAGEAACCACAVKAVEDALEIVLVETGALVANRERPRRELDVDDSARWAPFARVVEQG